MESRSLSVETTSNCQLVDLTDGVAALLPQGFDGVCMLFIKHTTAALTLAALQDGAGDDLLTTLPRLVPALDFRHQPPEHVPGHVLSALIGAGVSIPVHQGKLDLGEVQRIVLLEFQGPRARSVDVRLMS